LAEHPTVSVVLCVYNAQHYLSAALDSVLAQTCTDFELLLVDDGSTDGSQKVCDEYAVRDARIRVFHIENGGLAKARNFGVTRALGEYLVFVDADDECSPYYLEKMVAGIESHGVDTVICGVDVFVDPEDAGAGLRSVEQMAFAVGGERKIERDTCFGLFDFNTALWNKLFMRRIVVENGISCPAGSHYEDDAFWYQYAMHARSGYVIPEKLYRYRIRRGSIMDLDCATRPKNRRDFIEAMEFVTDYAKRNGLERAHARFLVRIWMAVYSHIARWFDETERQALRGEFVDKVSSLVSADNRLVEIGDRLVWINRSRRLTDPISWMINGIIGCLGVKSARFRAARSHAFWKKVS